MRILLAHNIHRLTGGADVFYFEMGNLLRENGHEVAYFSSDHEDNINTNGKEYFTDVVDYDDGNLLQKITGIPQSIYSLKTKEKFREAIRSFSPDLVHALQLIRD